MRQCFKSSSGLFALFGGAARRVVPLPSFFGWPVRCVSLKAAGRSGPRSRSRTAKQKRGSEHQPIRGDLTVARVAHQRKLDLLRQASSKRTCDLWRAHCR